MHNEHIVCKEPYSYITSYHSLLPEPMSWQHDTVTVEQFYVIEGN